MDELNDLRHRHARVVHGRRGDGDPAGGVFRAVGEAGDARAVRRQDRALPGKRRDDPEVAAGRRVAPGVEEPVGQGKRAPTVGRLVGDRVGIGADRCGDRGGKPGGQPVDGDVAVDAAREDGHPDNVLTDAAAGPEGHLDEPRGVDCLLQLRHRRPPAVDEDGIVVDRTDAEAHGLGDPSIVHRVAVPIGQPHGDGGTVARGHLGVVVNICNAVGQVVVD